LVNGCFLGMGWVEVGFGWRLSESTWYGNSSGKVVIKKETK
jgi:hypothetical protein